MDNEKQIILHSEQYLPIADSRSITPEDKTKFLEDYYITGNQTKSAKAVGRDICSMKYAMQADKAFQADFLAVKNAQKHNLEQTMYQNGLKEKGYMDRITWLRKNFPKEYNPNYVDKDNNPAEAIKELSAKLGEYQLIPKKDVIEG